jgi:hypothetical protein
MENSSKLEGTRVPKKPVLSEQIKDQIRDVLAHGTFEEKASLAMDILPLFFGGEPKSETTVLRPDRRVYGSFLSEPFRQRLITVDQLATLDRRHEGPATRRSFQSLESRLALE